MTTTTTTTSEPKRAPLPPAPGLVGEIAAWIEACAVHPAPRLALAASICTVAALCGRRYSLAGGLRPCLYVVGVARSGVGKEIGRQCAAALLDRAGKRRRIGTDDLASAAGLVARLRACPTQLFLLDEFGRLVEAYTSRTAGTHERQIVTTLMRLWSAHSGRFLGKAYAEKESPSVEHPHAVVYGTTTPAAFWRSMRGTDVVDGVLSRFLIVEQEGGQAAEKTPTSDVHSPPPELVERCALLAAGGVDAGAMVGKGSLADLESADVPASPIVVPMSVGAHAGARRIAENVRAKCESAPHEELWVRAREQALRVALAVALGRGSTTVEEPDLLWAWQLVRESVRMCERGVVELVADTEEARAHLTVLAAVRRAGGSATKRQITRATQNVIPRRLREDALRTLVDAGSLRVVIERSGQGADRFVAADDSASD